MPAKSTIREGVKIGLVTVLRLATPKLIGEIRRYPTAVWACECGHCGNEFQRTQNLLSLLRKQHRHNPNTFTGCAACKQKQRSREFQQAHKAVDFKQHTVSQGFVAAPRKRTAVKHCASCCGQPWRRPSDGTPCEGCGQSANEGVRVA